MRKADDPSVERFEVRWGDPGPERLQNWTTGWFWWRSYSTPASASVTIGVAGDIVFPIYCRWGDGEFYQMFLLRYDRVREAVDIIALDPDDSNQFNLDGDSTEVTVDYIDPGDFSPDFLFSELAKILDVALLTVDQSAEVGVDDDVWIPVDVGQATVEFATTDELARP